MDVDPTDDVASVRMLVPVSDGRQAILGRTVRPSAFRFREDAEPPNQWVGWEAAAVKPQKGAIAYSYTARTTDVWYDVPRLALADNPPPPDPMHLRPSERVQSTDPAIVRRVAALTRDAGRVDETTWSLFQYAASFLRSESRDAPDDAVSVLNGERGSPSGRARLLVALFRAAGIPARLVGGLRLEDGARKRATISWVEAWLGGRWLPFDPANGHYATLPANHLALYYGDLPLIEHTAKLGFRYDMLIHQVTRQALLAQEAEPPTTTINRVREANLETERVKTYAFYAEKPVASVVLITDVPVAPAIIERIVADARERSISVVFLSASFESRYFREHYLQRLIASNFDAIAEAHLLLVSTRDEAGLYALLQLGEHRVALRDARLVVAGGFPRSVGKVLGSVLYRLVAPGELVLVNPQAPLLSLWSMARANLIDGVPMVEAASLWDLRPQVIDADDV
ncbi:MAG: transglutaminase domain-containing protein, partial [Deltaproteobacteria bacterium]|nr:transglutaminase domain-containing protein [Deltaproteobacteria bacterium]